MSREAIAAALARDDLPSGERLVAFSLASFAGSDNRAWPGAAAAAARAGLSRSRYLYDRDRLVRRGLVVVEKAASGRGRASTVALPFVTEGPWWEGEINAELFEAVLSRSRARGPARLVLAAMAALADDSGIVRGLSGVELCAAACVDDHTYRRARKELLDSGELVAGPPRVRAREHERVGGPSARRCRRRDAGRAAAAARGAARHGAATARRPRRAVCGRDRR